MTYIILTLISCAISVIIAFKMEMRMYDEVIEDVESITNKLCIMKKFNVTISTYSPDEKIISNSYQVSVPSNYRGIETEKTQAIYKAASNNEHLQWVAAYAIEVN